MPRFHFPLQRLLEHRERITLEKQRAVGELERSRRQIEDAIQRQQRSVMSAKSDLRALLGSAEGPIDLRGAKLQANA
ncbi:MAG: hypothetical protein VYC34_05510, partial [Planctomycetota bacterium]|nr:hypothetical protein [Planctomycetota bacterium]